MKKWYILTIIVMLISVIGTGILLYLSPDTVPVHYNLFMEANRFGSKFEYLLFPAFTIIMGVFLLVYGYVMGRKQNFHEEKVGVFTGLFVTLLFTLLGFCFMYKAIIY